MGFRTGCEDGGSSSSTVGAESTAEKKSYVDPITGVEILRWARLDWVGKTSFRFVVFARGGRGGGITLGEEPLLCE